jgi:hypothetical protein
MRETRLLVSLTSYGPRIRWAFLAIESIIASGCRPSDIFLWLPLDARTTKALDRLVSRGLNIEFVTDYKSHKKYCYLDTVPTDSSVAGFVLADDDMIYPRDWYTVMEASAAIAPHLPGVMFGAQAYFVGDRVSFAKDPSSGPGDSRVLSMLFHPFSGSGFFIPTAAMKQIDKEPDHFMAACPSNDDIWLHRELFRIGLPIRNLGGKVMPPSIPFVAGEGLFQVNWHQGQNEIQLERAFRGLIHLPEIP